MTETDALDRLAALADELGAAELAAECRALAERGREGRFYVACVGQFKRGKSTLINALIGMPVLPSGVAPVTALPTVVRHGPLAARIRRADGEWIPIEPDQLRAWVTEEENPGNRRGAAAVEVSVPSPLLAQGMCLVDTPGLGSVFEANARATREFVPHIDAAVVVLGADPPISGDELALLEEVARQVDELVFVLNKIDRLPPDDLREAAGFTERVVAGRLGRPVGRMYPVSALAAARGDARAGAWDELVARLGRMTAESGQALVAGALARGVRRLGCRLEHVLLEHRAALLRPIEESERRARELGELAGRVERSLVELAPLLSVEQQRLSSGFEVERERFLAETAPAAREELRARLRAGPDAARARTRAQALEVANEVARARLEPWLAEAERAAAEAYRAATARFLDLARGFLGPLAESAGVQSADLLVGGSEEFEGTRRFYFTDLLYRHDPASPWVWIADALIRGRWGRRRAAAAAERYLADLLLVNAARVQGDLDERLWESRRRLEAEIRSALSAVHRTATRALDRARAAQAAGQRSVAAEIESLDRRLEAVRELAAPGQPSAVGA